MKNLSKREKMMLLVLGIVLVGYLYYSLFYSPVHKRIDAAKLNISKYIQEINTAKMNREQLEKQSGELEVIKVKYEEAKTILPQMEMNPEIVYNIQRFFQGSGVEVTSIAIGAPEELQNQGINGEAGVDSQAGNAEDSGTKENQIVMEGTGKLIIVPVTIALSGNTYEDVMKFISLFESDRRFVEITNIVITAYRPAVPVLNQTAAQSIIKPDIKEKKTVNNEIQVIIVGEGEEYIEIPVNEGNETVIPPEEEEMDSSQPDQSVINVEKSKPNIEANIIAKYYYIDSGINEKPIYEFKNGINGKKDIFK